MNELMTLNPQQQAAIEATERAVLILAGAGSGKTRVATLRIAKKIEEGVPPEEILGLTFTNKASTEMKERVAKWTHREVLISTFHSLGARVLRESITKLGYPRSFSIYDEDDLEKLLKECLAALDRGHAKADLKKCRSWISQAKNNLRGPEDFAEEKLDEMVPVYALYQKKLAAYGAVDFDDLLFLTVKLWKDHPSLLDAYRQRWKHLLVDEYQDTNQAQYAMTKLLVGDQGTLFVVGDPDQLIYSWRGANIHHILHFERDYPGSRIICLNQNYRSTETILEAANALIRHNTNRYEKKLWSDLGAGQKIRLFSGDTERAETAFIASQIAAHRAKDVSSLKEMVVFYRTNAQSRVFEDEFLSRKIPYRLIGGISFYQRKEIKDILAFLRLAHSGADALAFKRAIHLPKRGFGEATLDRMEEAAEKEQLTLFDYCQKLSCLSDLKHPVRLNASQKSSLIEFVSLIQELRTLAKQGSISELVRGTIEKTGYIAFLKQDRDTFEEKNENVYALVSKAIEWETLLENPSLEAFLEELSLKSSLDETSDDQEYIQLMTIHNSKGLEFEIVFLAGLEEDLFPHVNSRDNLEKIEEERRLCYVGMTRAKRHLYLSCCRNRFLWGTLRSQRFSRFLREIPEKYIEKWPQRGSLSTPESVLSMPKESSASVDTYASGDAVFHAAFGVGQVRDVFESSLGTMVRVFFAKEEEAKTLALRYAPLRKLKN